jgi:PAS domain S-box-containing protein
MKKPLRVIIIEDSEDDATLVVRALQVFGYEVLFERVDTSEGLQEAFERDPWDLVISDYSLPRFSVPEALKLLEKSGLELPFIIVSGKIGEETAVKMMKLGAHDYLLKDNLSRLDLSIEHELGDAKIRKDHRLAEAALRQSEERFRQLAEHIEEVFWMTNPEKSQTIYISPSYEKMWGRTCESLYSNPLSFLENIHPEDAPRILSSLKKQATGEYEEVYRIIKPDGTIRWIRDRAFPIKNEGGEVYRIAGIAEDITGRKLAEKTLEGEKERWFVTLKSIGDGVITTDTEGKVALMNEVAENLTGWNQSEAAGKPLSEVFNIISEQTRKPCENPIARVFPAGGIIGLANQVILISKEGAERSIADSGAPIRDQEGKTLGAVFIFRDVTEQRKMQEELLKMMKLESISLLAGGIAHDFNNILTAILGNISLAKMDLASHNPAYQRLIKTEQAAIRAKDLASQLLTFSKGGAPIKRVMSIVALLKDSVRFALRGSNIRPEFFFAHHLWPAEIDEGQMTQVIHNLVINAQQAMPDGGVLLITVKNLNIDAEKAQKLMVNPGNFISLSFKDNGRGIPKDCINKIFDPFFTTKEKGSGLGLFTTYSIIKKHDGAITVNSEEGVGTTFYAYLPAASGQHETEETTDEGIMAGSGRILILDDEPMVREMAGALLQKLGYEVEYASSGEEAIEIYKKAKDVEVPFKAVIMDLTLPGGISGKETIQKLIAYDPKAKAIVSSGYSNDPVMANYEKFGFKNYIAKPYRAQDLSRILHQVLHSSQV